MLQQIDNEIRTHSCLECYLCGTPGKPLYQGLQDRLFGAPGRWNLRKCSNLECGLVWLDPMPLQEDIGKAYKSYYTHTKTTPPQTFPACFYRAVRDGYLQSRFGYTQNVGSRWYRYLWPLAYLHPGGIEEIERSVMFLPALTPTARLLDIGCGSGQALARMRDIGWEVEGVDFDSVAVEVAQLKGIPAHLGDLRAQVYPDSYFNAIYMGHVQEHVYDPVGLLRECYRVLKPGGTLVVLTPNTDSWGHELFHQDWRGLEPPRHVYLYNSKTIRQVFKDADFDQVNIRTLAGSTSYILSMSYLLKYGVPITNNPNNLEQKLSQKFNRLEQKLRGSLYLFWERILLLARSHAGEEILSIAKKN